MRFRSLPILLTLLTIAATPHPIQSPHPPAPHPTQFPHPPGPHPTQRVFNPTPVNLNYTVSMEHPDRHLYHVVLTAAGLKGPVIDLRMPAWMPGYYQLLDYAKNLSGLRAVDERGQALPWEKTGRDAWIPFRAKPIATTLPILISCMIVLS